MSYPTFNAETTAEEVATAFTDQIKGKNVLITGTSLNGIGFETARAIAKYAHLVIITGYNRERLQLTQTELAKDGPSAEIRPLVVDLSSLGDVRRAAAEVNAYTEPIHVLINNAATAVGKYKFTVDGFESQMGTDHLGPFLFTALIAPKIVATHTAAFTPRVVFVSSAAHAYQALDLENLAKPDQESYIPMNAYAKAKAANVLTAAEISRRSKGLINGYSLHPGLIFTNIAQREETIAIEKEMGILHPDGTPNLEAAPWKSIPAGAATTVTAAFDPRLESVPGAYLDDCVVANEKIAPHAADPDIAAKLWEITEELVCVKFSV